MEEELLKEVAKALETVDAESLSHVIVLDYGTGKEPFRG